MLNESYPESWRASVAKSFGSRGIDFILGDYVDDLEINEGHVTTRSGKRIEADLVVSRVFYDDKHPPWSLRTGNGQVMTRGGRSNTKFVASLGDDVLSASGTVKVLPTLQVVGHPRIFAAGDIIEWKEQRQAGAKSPAHALVIANNALVLLGATKKAVIQYKGSKELILLINGKVTCVRFILPRHMLTQFLERRSRLLPYPMGNYYWELAGVTYQVKNPSRRLHKEGII